MATKKKRKQVAQRPKEDPGSLRIRQRQEESKADALAHTALQPTVQAALTLMDYNKNFGDMSINTLVDDLAQQCDLANNGNLARAEAMLTTQAHTLDAIFHALARKAHRVEYLNQLDANLRLALRAQSQCRATLETLAAIKNPQPVAFVRQANIAHGPQQVNNVTQPDSSRARDFQNQPNKLLEEKPCERLDTGAPQTTIGSHPAMEAVEELDGTQNRER